MIQATKQNGFDKPADVVAVLGGLALAMGEENLPNMCTVLQSKDVQIVSKFALLVEDMKLINSLYSVYYGLDPLGLWNKDYGSWAELTGSSMVEQATKGVMASIRVKGCDDCPIAVNPPTSR